MKKQYLVLALVVLISSSLAFSAMWIALAQQEEEYFFSIKLFQTTTQDIRVGEVLATELAKIGINVVIETGDFGVWIDRAGKMPNTHDNGGFDMSTMTWGWGTDPDRYHVFHSTKVRPYGWNVFAYKNAESDRLWEAQRTEMNYTKRIQIIHDIMEVFDDDPPIIPVNWIETNVVSGVNLNYYDAYENIGLAWAETFSYDPPEKDTLVWATSSDHKHMNPVFSREGGSSQFVTLVFDALVRWDKDKSVVPHLAESWTVSEDFLTWTFKIRDDVYWHDGEKFTAEDIAFTYTAVMDLELASVYTGIVGEALESAEAIDDYTVVIKFKEPYGPGINRFVEGPKIVPKHILGDVPYDEWKTHPFSTEHPIGTGAYKFVEWKPDDYTKFEANENYFRGAPTIKYFYYRVIPDKATAVVALENGEVDLASYSWTIDEYEHLKTVPTLKVDSFKPFSLGYSVCINTAHPILGNKFVVQAISHAIPREKLCKEILGEHSASPANQIFPIGWPWYNPNIPPIDYSIEKARALMEMAGYDYDWITPEQPTPWTAYLMPSIAGLVVGLIVGAGGTWALRRKT